MQSGANAELKGAILGCGSISEFHLRGWQRIPEVEIVALGDTLVERAHARRDAFAPKALACRSLSEILDLTKPDFVEILTPPRLHYAHCLEAFQAGIHVICQKPLCGTLQNARDLATRALGARGLFMVHENHRYRPWFRTILERIREADFGALRWMRLFQHDPGEPAEEFKTRAPQGILFEYGSHLVDMMRAALGEPKSVRVTLCSLNPKVRGESLAFAAYQYSGATAVIDIAWKPLGIQEGGLLLEGEEGSALYEGTMTRGDTARFRVFRRGAVELDQTRNPREDYLESFWALQREFVDAMLLGGQITQTAAEHLRTLEALFAAYRAAELGREVAVERQDPGVQPAASSPES
ncbi:MAG TPA: Gfo/Idh/MocA family oxidoreductase [Acidobacteriota bacterium]|nr:Gfo/Idh/MocA family oxidoreductase [Acidobacteriota bacterium]